MNAFVQALEKISQKNKSTHDQVIKKTPQH